LKTYRKIGFARFAALVKIALKRKRTNREHDLPVSLLQIEEGSGMVISTQ
jgi:hypothetical protein